MLTTPFKKTQAYKFGFIDERGNRIKTLKDENNQVIQNNPVTKDEKASLTPLHRLVFNLKKLIEKLPFGKTAFASYAVALALLKEETELPSEQADELFEKFYRHLKDNNKIDADVCLLVNYNCKMSIDSEGKSNKTLMSMERLKYTKRNLL
jgi:hypothetical protein